MKNPELANDGKRGMVAEPLEPPIDISRKNVSAAALRALEEAKLRRLSQKVQEQPKEIHGPNGLDPVRYGDWEKNGLISDF